LLAHELAHVVQQRGVYVPSDGSLKIGDAGDPLEHEADRLASRVLAGAAPAVRATPEAPMAPTAPEPAAPTRVHPRLRRKVSPQFNKIKDDLTYGLLDWRISDAEAREVLTILKSLSDDDLRDSVAAMDREGITGRLFDQLPEQDVKNNQAFLQKVARLRTWSDKDSSGQVKTRQGSCDPKQMRVIEAARGRGVSWLNTALQKLATLTATPPPAAQKAIADIFKSYFFSLERRVIDYVTTVLQGILADFGHWNLFRVDCFGEWSGSCHASGAFANSGPPPSVTLCNKYFEGGEAWESLALIHEFAHIQPNVTDITDRAYLNDRKIRSMTPPEALTNADSYALLIRQLALGSSAVSAPSDEFPDCPQEWTAALKTAAARAQRANRNAQVWLSNLTGSTVGRSLLPQELAWLGGKDDQAVKAALEAFDKAQDKFKESITFECEPDGGGRCDKSSFYWYSFGHLHVCPDWLKFDVHEREVRLLDGYYGYIGAGKSDRQLDLARLAFSVSDRGWAAPTATDVFGGPSAWNADSIAIEVIPVQPTVPNRHDYSESGFLHQRMSQELALYQGPECGKGPITFRQHLQFRIDDSSAPRPRPYLSPWLSAEFQLRTAGQSPTWRFEDRRPDYAGPGQPLQHQLPDPVTLSLSDDGTLHSRVVLNDPSSRITRLYEDDLRIKAKDPCPKEVTAKDPRPPVQKQDEATVQQVTNFVADVRGKIDTLLQGPAPKDNTWAVRGNPNVQAVLTLLTDLESDLRGQRLVIRFDQPTNTTAAARYESVSDEMHLQPLSGTDLAQEVVDLVHEYAHVKQDRAEEARLIAQKVPTTFGKDVDLQHEIEARERETYFLRLMQLAGVTFGPRAKDSFNAEVVARTFVREFETERTGNRAARRKASEAVRKEIEGVYAQQFKDNGSFGDYPIEITEDNRALLHASWTGKQPPIDLGAIPGDVASTAQLQSHLYRTLQAFAALPQLFLGPKKQTYSKVLFTVFFRQRRLLQFGFNKD
jgi:hypothetical protein